MVKQWSKIEVNGWRIVINLHQEDLTIDVLNKAIKILENKRGIYEDKSHANISISDKFSIETWKECLDIYENFGLWYETIDDKFVLAENG